MKEQEAFGEEAGECQKDIPCEVCLLFFNSISVLRLHSLGYCLLGPNVMKECLSEEKFLS